MEFLPIKLSLDIKADLTSPVSKAVDTLSDYFQVPLKIVGRVGKTGSILMSIADEKLEQKRLDIKQKSELSRFTTLELLQIKQNTNLNNIISKSFEFTKLIEVDDVSKDKVSIEWLNFFFENAKNISNEQLQNLWAKILAGEISDPNSFAIRTFDILKNLSTEEATQFVKLSEHSFLDSAGTAFIITDYHKTFEKIYDLNFERKLMLEEAGLVHNTETSIPLHGEMGGKVLSRVYLQYGVYEIEIISKGTDSSGFTSYIRTITFTKAGSSLSKFVQHAEDIQILKELSLEFRGNGVDIKYRKAGDVNWQNLNKK